MLDEVVVGEGLFDEQQVVGVEFGEMGGVGEGVGGVGVDLQQQVVAEALADGADGGQVPAGFDLQFDPDVALVEVAADGVEQLGDGVHDADRYAGGDAVSGGAEEGGQGLAAGAELGVQDGGLQGGFGHPVAFEGVEGAADGVDVGVGGQCGDEEAAQDVGGAVDVFGGVERVGHGDALGPALGVGGDDPHEQHVAFGLGAERGAEGGDQWHRDPPQFDSSDLHFLSFSAVSRSRLTAPRCSGPRR
ncbi:hypothetical protein Aros01_09488 [Streptosporangium roseum]